MATVSLTVPTGVDSRALLLSDGAMSDAGPTRPLWRKLGIAPGVRYMIINAPADFALDWDDPGGVPPDAVHLRGPTPPVDCALLFSRHFGELEAQFSRVQKAMTAAGGLWVGYPKKSAALETDLDFTIVQALGLEAGLVDNKICAVDATWSAVRFVVRLRDRPKR